MARELSDDLGIQANIVPGEKGIFDIIVDGELVFSKYTEGRFPQKGEIKGKIK